MNYKNIAKMTRIHEGFGVQPNVLRYEAGHRIVRTEEGYEVDLQTQVVYSASSALGVTDAFFNVRNGHAIAISDYPDNIVVNDEGKESFFKTESAAEKADPSVFPSLK